MPCFRPLRGWRSATPNPETGKRPITFVRRESWSDSYHPINVPCGQCGGCRLERSRQWAMRCYHEISLWPQNSFITLTYNDDYLPSDGSLHVTHFQQFMKRLRHHAAEKVRFFHCGEYGETTLRPHYHAILFNKDFGDKIPWQNHNGNLLCVSSELASLWPWGFSSVGAATFQSSAYVARYIMKKALGTHAEEPSPHQDPETGWWINRTPYERVCPYTGEIHNVAPEYTTMSRRPGIGRDWLTQFKPDLYPNNDPSHGDFVVVQGKKMRPPKAYDQHIELTDPKLFRAIKRTRKQRAKIHADNNTDRRLHDREICSDARSKQLTRILG